MKYLLDPSLTGAVSTRTLRTIERLNVKSGMHILDAGCGPGRLTIPLAKIVGPHGTVTAIDLQEGMLHEVNRKAKKQNLNNIRYIQAGIGDGKIENNFYNRATLITVIGEIPGRENAIDEIFNSLKSEGLLLIEETIRDPHFQTRSTVTGLAKNSGFNEIGFYGNRISYTIIFQKT